jgi:hypothetical protein
MRCNARLSEATVSYSRICASGVAVEDMASGSVIIVAACSMHAKFQALDRVM